MKKHPKDSRINKAPPYKIVTQIHYVFDEYLFLILDFLQITSEPLGNKKIVLRVHT